MVNGRPLADITVDLLAHLEAANQPPILYVRAGLLTGVRIDETKARSSSR